MSRSRRNSLSISPRSSAMEVDLAVPTASPPGAPGGLDC